MHKFICIGDVHADFTTMWDALRAASCLDAQGHPTPPVQAGVYQVVFIGDLVHPKSAQAYTRLTGLRPFDPGDQEHLLIAAHEQIKHLEKLRTYHLAAPHAIHFLLGNHDDNVLNPHLILGTSGGIKHVEFDPRKGGVHLPEHLRDWMQTFPRDIRVGHLQFTHVSPLPGHQHYDDLFYSDRSPKRWFRETPEYVEMAGLTFGVYGHTQVEDGILIHYDDQDQPRFAIIDALHTRQYLEIMHDDQQENPIRGIQAVPF